MLKLSIAKGAGVVGDVLAVGGLRQVRKPSISLESVW
jgi:hypothetical protein